MEFLREPQAVRQGFFRVDAIGGWGQGKIAVADQAGITQNRQHWNGRALIQRGHAVLRHFLFPAR